MKWADSVCVPCVLTALVFSPEKSSHSTSYGSQFWWAGRYRKSPNVLMYVDPLAVQRRASCMSVCFLLDAVVNALHAWWFLHLYPLHKALSSVVLALKLLVFTSMHLKIYYDWLIQIACDSTDSWVLLPENVISSVLRRDQEYTAAASGLWTTY